MTPAPEPAQPVPLCADLDGTLIKTDLTWESLILLARRNPPALLLALFWWMRGRAYLKQQLAKRVRVDAGALPYNNSFVQFLRDEKAKGRKLVLATASDRAMAQPVFDHVALFDELLASDGKTNLRDEAKRKALVQRFGEHGFDYAGNSSVDLGVWPSAREAIVVNAGRELVQRAKRATKLGPTFTNDYSPLFAMKRYLFELFIRGRFLLAIIGGLLLAGAFPNLGIAGLAWVAPGIIAAAAYRKERGEGFWIGYVAGIAFWLASLYWLLLIPVAGYPVLGWVALCVYLALFPATWLWILSGAAGQLSGNSSWLARTSFTLLGAAAWVGLEIIRGRLLSGFPWNFMGASQFQMLPLIQIASLVGVYGVSFLVVWTSLSLYSAAVIVLRKPTMRYAWMSEIILPLAAVLAFIFFGMAKLRETDPAQPTIKVASVQPSIPQTMIWDPEQNHVRFGQLMGLTEQALATKPDLLLWPEAALPELNESSYAAITSLIRTHQAWMILGADDVQPKTNTTTDEQYDVYNAAFLFRPDGELVSIYHKQNLVIFGEYVPLLRWFPFVKWFTPITGGFAAGDRPVPFELERRPLTLLDENGEQQMDEKARLDSIRVKTSVLICFEDTFPHLVRDYVDEDTDFLVNLTNDGWFGEGAAQWQHAATAVFRAVENGIPLLRSCNTGVTCWVDSRGRLRQVFRDSNGTIYGSGIMTAAIPVLAPGETRSRTLYNEHGDWFGWACVGIAVLAAVFCRSRTPAN